MADKNEMPIEVIDESDTPTEEYEEPKLSGRSACSQNWAGFKKSIQAVDSYRKYKAMCKYCDKPAFLGTKDNLIAHKKICKEMPEHIRKLVEKAADKKEVQVAPKITTAFKKITVTQELLDELLGMSFVLGDTSFR